MFFSFLHAADLHLGSPFTGLTLKDEAVAKRFAAASREAFSSLVETAINAKVAFVVIAGDVYDGEWKDASIGLFFNREVSRLERAGIPVFLLKGNHDAESVVTKAISLPDSVHQFPTTKAKTFPIEDLKVALHGRSFPDRAVSENYALAYPAPLPGYFNIGVLHTSCDGRPGHANYAPCTVQELASRNYHYWALGHVHEYEVLSRDPWIVFPGNLQGRSVRELGPKGAVIVDVADGHVTDVRRVIVDCARWAEVSVDLEGIDQEAEMLRKVTDTLQPFVERAEGRLVALRVRLVGPTSLHRHLKSDPRTFADEVQAAAHRCHEDVWLERLQIETKETTVIAASCGPLEASPDLSATLMGLDRDPDVRALAGKIVASIGDRLPAGIIAGDVLFVDELDKLLEDASALVLGRSMQQQEN
jgi:DNA repair protein SbcD/Mre11